MASTTSVMTPVKYEICHLCGSVGNLLKCVRCKRAYYCSRDHQSKHWKYHKYMCEEMAWKHNCDTNKCSTSTSETKTSDLSTENENSLNTYPALAICDTAIPSTKTGENSSTYFSADWLSIICEIMIKDMNNHGICVVDKFLGCSRGEACLEEAMKLYESGHFKAGQVIKSVDKSCGNVRGDFITWVNGTECSCQNIGILIKCLDGIVRRVNKQPNNGKFRSCDLSNRTKVTFSIFATFLFQRFAVGLLERLTCTNTIFILTFPHAFLRHHCLMLSSTLTLAAEGNGCIINELTEEWAHQYQVLQKACDMASQSFPLRGCLNGLIRSILLPFWLREIPPLAHTSLTRSYFQLALGARLCAKHKGRCGRFVDERIHHPLACRYSAGRFPCHAAPSDIIRHIRSHTNS